ncbi:MAG: ATP-dependent transcriptional regulator [Anaerocolumna sp.]|jgi:LuxR family maltose regulon positive regulatory protein|nr:ATP-dependent transcriptional regulator [Anaerocolumna sp.]
MDKKIFLDTKLHMPSVRQNHICRDILNNRLDEGLDKEHRIFLVSAPAGYGKTTLISGWLNRVECKYTWLSLDEYDNEPSKFICYLLEAVRKINKNFGSTIEGLMMASNLPTVKTVSLYIARELEQLQESFILVLDDYNVIQNNYINELLQKLFNLVSIRFVIITRKEPALTFSKWRVEDKLTELNARDLKFARAEIDGFFSRYFNLTLKEQSLEIIEKQTEGWVAGMQLIGLSLTNMESNREEALIKEISGNNRFITEYLMDEVLKNQDEQLRIFLNKTCILKEFNGELCEAVTGMKDSRTILQQLEKENLFIISLDDTNTWYRYHHFFSEFLRKNQEETEKVEICRIASLWCKQNGYTEAALEYALHAKDGETASYLVKDRAIELFHKGELKNLLALLNSDLLINKKKDGILEIYKAWCMLFTGEIDEASKIIHDLKNRRDVRSSPIISGMIKASAPYLLNNEDKVKALKDAEEAITLVEDEKDFFYFVALTALGHANALNGHTSTAAALHAKVHEGACKNGYYILEVTSLHDVAIYLNCMGKGREALALCEKTLERFHYHAGNYLPMGKIVYLSVGMLLYYSNKLEEAQKYLEEGIAVYRELGFAHWGGLGEWYLVLTLYNNGEKEKAFEIVYRLKAYYKEFKTSRIALFFDALEMELYHREGNYEKTSRWLKEPKTTFDKISGLSDINPYFTYLRVLISQKDYLTAQIALTEKEEILREEGRFGELITALLLSALVKKHLGMEDSALDCLREAVTLAAPEGYERIFLDEGSELLELVTKVRDTAPAFIDKICCSGVNNMNCLADPLRKRELEILKLIAEGLSNNEIAEILFITTGTVKWHINNMFSKLGVNKRTQAVVKARRLELIN